MTVKIEKPGWSNGFAKDTPVEPYEVILAPEHLIPDARAATNFPDRIVKLREVVGGADAPTLTREFVLEAATMIFGDTVDLETWYRKRDEFTQRIDAELAKENKP